MNETVLPLLWRKCSVDELLDDDDFGLVRGEGRRVSCGGVESAHASKKILKEISFAELIERGCEDPVLCARRKMSSSSGPHSLLTTRSLAATRKLKPELPESS